MKKLLLTITGIITAFTFCFAQNGEKGTKFYTVKNITGITAGYTFQIEVTEGSSDKIEISAPVETLEALIVKISNEVLILDLDFTKAPKRKNKGGKYVMSKGNKVLYGPINVKMEMAKIEKIKLSGAASVKTSGTFKGEKLSVSLSGASAFSDFTTAAKSVNAHLSGASRLNLNGEFEILDIEQSGATKLSCTGNYMKGSFSLSGASTSQTNGNSENLSIELSGSSKIRAKGNADKLKVECSGASKANLEDMNAKVAEIEQSGATKVIVNVEEKLNAELSGASRLEYKFLGQHSDIHIEKSRASKATRKE